MDYKVVVTRDAEADLESFIKYLIIEKESPQAAENVLHYDEYRTYELFRKTEEMRLIIMKKYR